MWAVCLYGYWLKQCAIWEQCRCVCVCLQYTTVRCIHSGCTCTRGQQGVESGVFRVCAFLMRIFSEQSQLEVHYCRQWKPANVLMMHNKKTLFSDLTIFFSMLKLSVLQDHLYRTVKYFYLTLLVVACYYDLLVEVILLLASEIMLFSVLNPSNSGIKVHSLPFFISCRRISTIHANDKWISMNFLTIAALCSR